MPEPAQPSQGATIKVAPVSAEDIAAAERNLRLNAQDGKAHMTLAALYLRAGKQPEAARELRAVIRVQPHNLEAYRQLATLYRNAGYLDREYLALRSALSVAPDDTPSELRLADIAMEEGWFDVAQTTLDRVARAVPRDRRVCVGQASLALLQHHYPQMEAFARIGLQLAPNDAALEVVLSEACRLQNHLLEAEQALRSAIAHRTDTQSLTGDRDRLAHLLLEPDWHPLRTADAAKEALNALQSAPDDLEARYWLARAQELQGNIAAAEMNYARVARQDIQFEALPFFLGRIYQRATDPNRRREGKRLIALYGLAEKNGRQYESTLLNLRKHPDDPTAHRKAAQWHIKAGHIPQAILELRRVLELDPHDQAARTLLGRTLIAMGRTSEAKHL